MTSPPPSSSSPLTRAAVLLGAMLALAGCVADQLLGPGFNAAPSGGAATAAVPPAPTRMPPPVELVGRWVLASPNAGFCNVHFGSTPGASEGTIAPEGGCPGNFFTSRKWTFEAGGLVLRDHTGQQLARLAAAGAGRFEGETTSGQAVSLTR